uniref:Arrestin C-terminal-like domain-containing protein n=1 Tax=Mola mola TaxID=94237 RepID=A0A3Q3W680_MOLML
MPSIQSLTMTYEALNEYETFSEGDTLRGKVTLALMKETVVESLLVKLKGDADVRWTKKVGDRNHTYSAHRRYFKLRHFLIPEAPKGSINTKILSIADTLVPPGTHVYDFSFNIPPGGMPSSFRGSHGKIVYLLEVKLSRSWRVDRTVEKEIKFASKSIPNLRSFTYVIINEQYYVLLTGETIAVVAKINNSSTSEITPKFSLIRDVVFRAQSNTNYETINIHKVVDRCIKPQTQKTVNCAIKIPNDLILSIQNCDLISVEYHLKVYLDISFASDPKVVFPLIICPPNLALGSQPGGAMGPYSASCDGGPSNSDFAPPYPAQALASPYGDPFSSPSSVLHPPPSAPTFYPPPSAAEITPSVTSPPANVSSAVPPATYASAPLMDFLCQSDEPPPSYSLLFPSSEQSNAK